MADKTLKVFQQRLLIDVACGGKLYDVTGATGLMLDTGFAVYSIDYEDYKALQSQGLLRSSLSGRTSYEATYKGQWHAITIIIRSVLQALKEILLWKAKKVLRKKAVS